ncbi:hypothetical protein [Lyngbya aestuarii]|uniref:hypothetical protein n=1 Tax=Lyngbya aestuarii TaxID=118322 RepID=UPI00403E12B1
MTFLKASKIRFLGILAATTSVLTLGTISPAKAQSSFTYSGVTPEVLACSQNAGQGAISGLRPGTTVNYLPASGNSNGGSVVVPTIIGDVFLTYLLNESADTLEFTFDPGTGAFLQSAVKSGFDSAVVGCGGSPLI